MEAEIVGGQRAVRANEISIVTSNDMIIASLVRGVPSQVAAKSTKTCVELLKHDDLGFYFTDLFSDDSLGHLLEDGKALLNYNNVLRMANELVVLLNDGLGKRAVGEVLAAVEIVKATKRGAVGVENRPVITTSKIRSISSYWRRGNGDSGDSQERDEIFREHCVYNDR